MMKNCQKALNSVLHLTLYIISALYIKVKCIYTQTYVIYINDFLYIVYTKLSGEAVLAEFHKIMI